ncbi:hypothetical protein FB451DRAFT_1385045 [Mycena latifolia]|nr:hypothetical protein FB451DRAFT_1385045 [Mycena latifolia]
MSLQQILESSTLHVPPTGSFGLPTILRVALLDAFCLLGALAALSFRTQARPGTDDATTSASDHLHFLSSSDAKIIARTHLVSTAISMGRSLPRGSPLEVIARAKPPTRRSAAAGVAMGT